jgi:hypothetical protein
MSTNQGYREKMQVRRKERQKIILRMKKRKEKMPVERGFQNSQLLHFASASEM